MMHFHYRVAAAAIIAAVAGCNDGTAPSVPTPPSGAAVSLITPGTNDGAVVVTLTGPRLSDIQAASSHYLVYSRLVNSQEARIIVIGDLVAGPLFTVTFGSPQSLAAYSGSILQVATRGDSILASTAGYQLSIAETSPTAQQP